MNWGRRRKTLAKNKNRALSILTVSVIAISLFSPLSAQAEETISISTVTDFKDFTEKCVYDEYSKNKKFVLENDIDLAGVEIKNAEVFCGVFEGGGHSIKNVNLEFEGSNKGLFSSLSKDAQVRDLNVSGTIKVSEEKGETTEKILRRRAAQLLEKINITYDDLEDTAKAAGGIVGYNEGLVINCSFDGKINGKRQVGGIVGFNTMRGVVDSCKSSADVVGDNETGGICGYNEGRLKLSQNEGKVCPEANENTINAGGIAGNSEGAVVQCTNNGEVGGDSFGDNIGGICGKQSGEIRECVNNAAVKGRRSVGGICGRFEPYTDIELTYQSAKAALDKQLEDWKKDVSDARKKMTDLFDELTDGKGIISDILDRLGIKEGTTGNRLDRLTDSATSMMDNISDTTRQMRDKNLTDSVINSLNSLTDFSSETKDTLKDLSGSVDTTLGNLDDFMDEFDGKGQELTDTLDNLNDAIDKGEEDVDVIRDKVFEQTDLMREDLDKLSDNLDTTHTNLQNMMRSVRNMGGSATDFFEDIDDSVVDTQKAVKRMKERLEEITKPIRDARNKISDLRKELSATPAPTPKAKPAAEYSESGYSVDADGSLDSGYDVEPSIVGKAGGLLSVTAYAADDDKLITAISYLRSTDISMPRLIGGENADTALVRYCINNAGVTGTELAGGVAGSTGFESTVRSGDSITLPDGTKVDADSVLKAVIECCVSDGAVKSKNDYAGGICGKCDIGNIRKSLTTGEITSTDGSYAGGVAGYSRGEITDCIAINDVDAKSYLGGIAGSGKDIKTSYSLARLDGKKDKSGAIAGFASGDVSGTYFIDEGLSGISGANLEGKAEPVAPSEIAVSDGNIPSKMRALNNGSFFMETGDLFMPQIAALARNDAAGVGALLQSKSAELSRFHFKVSFIDKDKELRSMVVDYGTKLQSNDIPKLTADGQEVPLWDKDITAPIVRHTKFTAVYNKATATISTGEEPPLLLVESVFDDNTEVKLNDETTDFEFGGYKKSAAYSFELSKSAYDVIKVHIRDEEKKAAKIAVFDNGKWTLLDCTMDGSYAVFTVGAPCKFVVLYKNAAGTVTVWIIIGLAVIALAAGGYIAFRKIKKRTGEGKVKDGKDSKN